LIFGVGTDIVDIERIRLIHQKFRSRFVSKILSSNEVKNLKHSDITLELATSFAAKEATAKALGTGFRDGVYPRTIQLYHDDLGKPLIKVTNGVLKLFRQHHIRTASISISHEAGMVLAFVILEK